jgi:hypothetical protein
LFAAVGLVALPVRGKVACPVGFAVPAETVGPVVLLRFGEVTGLVVFAGVVEPPGGVVVFTRFVEATEPLVRLAESKALSFVRLAATVEFELFGGLPELTAGLAGVVVFGWVAVVVLLGVAPDEVPVDPACDSSIFMSDADLAII